MALLVAGPVPAVEAGSSGAAVVEAWYANWYAEESGLDAHGIGIDYRIDPSVVWTYSVALNHEWDSGWSAGVMVDYLASAMQKDWEREDDGIAQGFQGVGWGLLAGPSKRWHVFGGFAWTRFRGRAELGDNAWVFGREPGETLPVDGEWIRADLLLLSHRQAVLFGAGYRYLRYNRPQAVVEFVGHENDDSGGLGMVESDQVRGGTFRDARLTGHYLLLGAWDPGAFGFPSDRWLFGEFVVFVGAESLDNGEERFSGGVGAGVEGALGLQYGWTWFQRVRFNARAGYRLFYTKSSLAEETGETDGGTVYRGFVAVDLWHGPFVGLSVGL